MTARDIIKDIYLLVSSITLELILDDEYLRSHFEFLGLFSKGICFY